MSYRKHLYGNLPVYTEGLNKGRIIRSAVASRFGFSHAEIVKAYNNWLRIFRIEGSNLTFEQYLQKLKDANITPSLVGKKREQYNLARINDRGPYTDVSCRFITTTENCNEQDKSITIHQKMINKYGEKITTDILSTNGRLGGKAIAGLPRRR